MDLGIRGKVAMVAAGSKGLGRAAALALGAEGCAVSLCGRGAEALEATRKELEALGVPALAVAEDGTLYGAGGMKGHTQIIRWRPGGDRIESFFNLTDPRIHDGPARIHELAVDTNHRLYLAENDNHQRSSYLWTARLP